MSDTGKIVLAILGTGLLLGLGYAAFSGPSTPAGTTFTPDPTAPTAPPTGDAGTEAVRQTGTVLNTFLGQFMTNRDRQAQRDADAAARRESAEGALGSGGKGGGISDVFSWTQADRDRSAADLAAKNGSLNPR